MRQIDRRSFLRWSAAGAGALALSQQLGLPSASAAPPSCRWGAFVEPADPLDPADPLATTEAFEAKIGRRLGMTRHYLRWNYKPIPSLPMEQSANDHRVPFMDWRPQKTPETGAGYITWGDIASGLLDARI